MESLDSAPDGDIAHIRRSFAKALAERDRDKQENKIRYYNPACLFHFPKRCPSDCTQSKHLDFHKSRAKTRFFVGGNSSGKSYGGMAEMIMRMCFKTHPYNGLALPHPAFHRIEFESFRNLESYYLPLLKEWVPRSMLIGNSWSDAYNVKFNILKLKNGDLIDFLSFDIEISKFESSTIHDIWADEKMPEDVYDANLSRLLRTDGYLWNTVTPINGMPWLMTRVWGLDEPDIKTWLVDMDENPYISAESKKRVLEQMSPEEREARKSGRPMQFQGIVYPEIQESVHISTKKPEPFWPIYFCLDAHTRKAAFGCWIAIDPGEGAYVIDEMEMKGTPQELAHHIFHKEYEIRRWIGGGPFRGVQKRWIDLSAIVQDSEIQMGYDLLAEFSKLGLSFSKANRSNVGYTIVKNYLAYDKLKPIGPFNKPMLYFCKGRVPKTYFSMTHILYDDYKHRQGKDPKEKVKDWGKDPADTVRYILIEKPRYQPFMKAMGYGGVGLEGAYVNR